VTVAVDLVHKICRRCGATAGLTRMEVAAGYKCLRCGGFFEDFVPLQGTEREL
jgi:DNA-directed RNA polymerase subunit RPC12/RpoP